MAFAQYRLEDVLSMGSQRFFALLKGAGKHRRESQEAAILAASFPWMEAKDRSRVIASLRNGGASIEDSDDDSMNVEAIARLRRLARRQGAKIPVSDTEREAMKERA